MTSNRGEGEYYIVEEKHPDYRFRSLFNGCAGVWGSYEEAIKNGEAHARLLERYFNACANTAPTIVGRL